MPIICAMWRQTVGRLLSLLAGPYGYTVSIWATGAIAAARYGAPDIVDAVAFPMGAVTAFLLMAVWSRAAVGAEIPERVSAVLLINFLPIPSIAVGALCTLLPSKALGFGAAGFGATLTYVLSAAILINVGSSPPER